MSVVRALAIRLRPFAPQLVLAGLCVAAASASTFALVPLAKYSGGAFAHLTAASLDTIVLGLIGLYAARGVFTFAQSALSAHVAIELTARLREELFAHLLAQGLRFHQRQRVADLASRLVQDLGVLQQSLAALLAEFVPSVVVIAFALGYIVLLNWRLALCTFVGVPLVGLAIARFGARLNAISTQVQSRVADVFVRAQESLAAVLVVKAFGREESELARFEQANRAHAGALWRSGLVLALQNPAIAVLQTAALAGVLWVGGDEILHGRLASADLLAFAAAIGIAVDPTLALSAAWSKLQQSLGAAARVFELLDDTDRLPEPPAPVALSEARGALAFEDVSFAYGAAPVLERVSLEIAPGEVVALVGPSGGGKTTLAHLALRLFDPAAGRVCLDGHDLRTLASADRHRAIAYVSQEPVLFDATVYENVAFGDPHATPARVEAACRAANAHDFVSALPDGYQTRLGERGASLSGGQRQRLAIARALLKNAPVLVLDEATSALDNASEEAVREAIARLMAGRTTLVIAHRMSAIALADRIVVLDGGRVVEAGGREALLRQNGLFRRLYEAGGPLREIRQ